ncbi:Reticulon-domain-containing protein [Fusarium flagelliforme]|uniref:Reticulon-domain-containing protein n=1 Tax=Fusarium flagelliforme TaxID=2675880 RepID=UPI001E8D3846|nr:Reticulon-domain-containing protein [Fusarium flagelliforme]KAH7185116.1 Reticulon-domain-containing protein [Fusarium flagelliforme]
MTHWNSAPKSDLRIIQIKGWCWLTDMSGLRNEFQPVLADDTSRSSQLNGERRQSGPLKEIIAQQDSLYKYISWEDPARTIGSYFAALGFLLAVHHLHLTQLALKTSAIGLGVMSLAEFAGRSFGPNNFVSRMRPKQYKTVPESTLNATLKDVHDLTQYAVVQAQKVIFAEDLEKTFAGFAITTSLYFLVQFMTPFGIAILALTTVYIIPLVTSPRGRGIARDGMVRAQEISVAAVDQASTMAQDSKESASNMTSNAQSTATNLTSSAQDTANNLRQRAGNMLPAMMQSNTESRPKNVSDVTSSVPHSSSGPTQAKDISSKYPKDDMSFQESKDKAARADRDMAHSFDKSPKSSFSTSDNSNKGFSQSAVQGFPSPANDSSFSKASHGHSDDFGAVTSGSSNSPASLTSNVANIPSFTATGSDMPSYAQHRSSNQAPAGKRPSIDDGNYTTQNKMGQGSEYQHFVPREAPNRGGLATTDTESMGKMPLGDLIDQKNQAGEKAPPLSAGGLNAMK